MLPPGAVHAYHDYYTLAIDAFYFSPQHFSHEELLALRGLSGFWNLLIALGTTSPGAVSAPEERLDHHLHLSHEQHREVDLMIMELCNEFVAQAAEATFQSPRWQLFFHRMPITLDMKFKSMDTSVQIFN